MTGEKVRANDLQSQTARLGRAAARRPPVGILASKRGFSGCLLDWLPSVHDCRAGHVPRTERVPGRRL